MSGVGTYPKAVSSKTAAVEINDKRNGACHGIRVLHLITVCAEDLFLNIFRVASATYADMSRTCLVILAGAGILIAEYRLNVPGLVMSILAMLFAGVARGLWKTAVIHHPDVLTANVNQASLQVMVGALVGVVSALVFGMNGRIFAFEAGNGFLLGLNALSTAMAIQLGKSAVLPMDDGVVTAPFHSLDDRVHRICDAVTIAVFTGLAGCYSTLLTRRSYTNVYQICCFWLAIMCISSWPCARMPHAGLPNTRLAQSMHGRMRSSSWPVNRQVKPFWKYVAGVGIASLWITYGVLNFTERQEPYRPASLDQTYVASMPVEIVVSMYKEPIEGVAKLIRNLKSMPAFSDAYITIYLKDNGADNDRIKSQIQANQVITLPNIGREGETYLNHILNRWDSLAQQTIFLQAEIHNPREFYTRINNYYIRGRTGYLDLGWVGTVCNCNTCSDRLFWTDEMHLIPQTYQQVYGSSSLCSYVLLSYKGQFAASAARIRGIDRGIYQGIWQALVDDKSWAHQDKFLHGRPDELSAPDFGYTVERLWSMLFQCSSADLAWKCPSLPWPIVERFLKEQADGAIGADVGCGNGKYLAVNDKVWIVGSDRSTNLAKIARQHEPHDVVVADNLALPHPNGIFDFAISIAVVHHLSTPARRVEAVKCVLDLLKRPTSPNPGESSHKDRSTGGGRALIYVWALEQKDSRRGWDEGHEQDVMVPWVLKQKKEKEAKRKKKEDVGKADGASEKDKTAEGDKTFLRYYHLYRKGELEGDIEQAGGVVLESGYEKDNWWAIASLR
ncbi:phospholipid-translocating p-type atpase [Curvularia clavata]|uniref:Phospholipid-translocating p-type atpase n=1 Tax=Curvularia clavata TaxID=95742 RepID=A0A9Q8ZG72_CURCL|nr:phospholipid-translocating p-type atpase [Curvularia clavata]